MSYRVRQIAPESKLSHECSLEMISHMISQQEMLNVLYEHKAFEKRERRLRSNPRVIKRRASKFDVKRPHHLHPPQPKSGILFSKMLLF